MANSKTTVANKRECTEALSTELSKSVNNRNILKAVQLAGDFSAETARKINMLNYHIEVLKNRINGTFDNDYRNEIELTIPKQQRK